jgi:preprotein translocase subunit SecA
MSTNALLRPGLTRATTRPRDPDQRRLRDHAGDLLARMLPGDRARSLARHHATLPRLRAAQPAWTAQLRDPASAAPTLRHLRAALAREGLPASHWSGRVGPAGEALVQACAAADAAARAVLGLAPHDGQWIGALAMLEGRLAEMATGEGKTLAMALGAAVGGLAGFAVHAITANDYLVQRDESWLRPFFAALGLQSAHVLPGQDAQARRAAWRADITYTTASELVFDHLRDGLDAPEGGGGLAADLASLAGQAAARPQPLLRGLELALVDEADSVLLDDAMMPLVLSQPVRDPAMTTLLWRAQRAARELRPLEHFVDGGQAFEVRLTDAGRDALDAQDASAHGTADGAATARWPSRRERDEWVARALGALHRVQRDRDYLVRDGAVHIVDAVTGRLAAGRVWSQGLHALVALKEGLTPPAETRTLAQLTYQRFFPRYLRLAGMSGTLREGAAELARVYRLRVLPVPLRLPSRRAILAPRAYADAAARRADVAMRCAELARAGRAVLVGTDSVAESEALSAALDAAGLPHAVLNARQDRDEAHIVAQAGQPGRVTVATRMAGRGTDIAPAPEVLARGGLHVLSCQRNPSARLDRQLAGRCARQGQPGSHEHWHFVDPAWELPLVSRLSSLWGAAGPADNPIQVPAWVVRLVAACARALADRRSRAERLAMTAQDRERERRLRFSGTGA